MTKQCKRKPFKNKSLPTRGEATMILVVIVAVIVFAYWIG
jgi:hypothetical protein